MSLKVLPEVLEYESDFSGGTANIACEPLAPVLGSGATVSLVNSVEPYIGIVSLNTPATAAIPAAIAIDPTQFLFGQRPYRVALQFRIPSLATGINTSFSIIMGFDASTALPITPTNALRLRIDGANTIWTEMYAGGVAVGGPNSEVPFPGGLVANTWYNVTMDVGAVFNQSNLTYTFVGGPTVGARFYMGIDPGTGVPPSPSPMVFLGEYPVANLPTTNVGFVFGIVNGSSATAASVQIGKLKITAAKAI